MTTETEIVVRGTLFLEETTLSTDSGSRGSWGGIVAASSGAQVTIQGSTIVGAQYGLMMLNGTAQVNDSTFENNEVGMAAALGAWVIQSSNTYRNNQIATAAWHTVNLLKSPTDIFEDNDDDALSLTAPKNNIQYRELLPVITDRPPVTREYMGEVALSEDTVWSGTVVIDGQVAVPAEFSLTIEPGTHVLFSFRDTNGDGLGESWIIVQGTIKVMGEEDAWVLFDSEDPVAGPGAWDSLSIIASDSTDNFVKYAIFRHGAKAFHTHFSQARLDHVIFEDNLRGIQFQESEGTEIDWVTLRRNQSGARFRDSQVSLKNVVAVDNVAGINFLRSSVTASDIVVTGSFAESFVSRESETELTRAAITGNVRGPRFKGDGEKVTLRESMVRGNLTEGLSFNNVTSQVVYCDLSENGFTGLSITDADVNISNSRLSGNGRFEIDNNGSTDVIARYNDWGTKSEPEKDKIYDGRDEEGIGRVHTGYPENFTLAFPGMDVPKSLFNRKLLIIGDVMTTEPGELLIVRSSKVLFSGIPTDSLFDLCSDHPSFPSSELIVRGTFRIAGSADEPITFTPLESGTTWGSLNLVGARGGDIRFAVFRNAATGIHAREAGRVSVCDSLFEDNEVGMRFSRSDVTIKDNIFQKNRAGLRFHDFGGTVEGNTFENNNTALFVTDNPVDVTLRDNVFRESSDYHVKLGIHVTEDVTIEAGEFDVPAGKVVGDLLFDKDDDEELGRVLLLP